jgi:hypothetical protein
MVAGGADVIEDRGRAIGCGERSPLRAPAWLGSPLRAKLIRAPATLEASACASEPKEADGAAHPCAANDSRPRRIDETSRHRSYGFSGNACDRLI